MSTTDCLGILLQLLIVVGVFWTLKVYQDILTATKEQVTESRKSNVVTNTIDMAKFLQSEEVRTARRHLYKHVQAKKWSDWSEMDQDEASTVCAAFDLAAMLSEQGMIDRDNLFGWGPVITRCHAICLPLLEKRRQEANAKSWQYFTAINKIIPPDDRWNGEVAYLAARHPE